MTRATTGANDESSWLRLERRPGETLRAALGRSLRDAIREGALREGVQLPSSRALATQLGVSRGVATDVYAQLEAQGFVLQRARAAPVVAAVPVAGELHARQAAPEPAPARFDLSATAPDPSLFPLRDWLAAQREGALRAPLRAFDYGDPRGERSLRETLADHLGRTRGVVADPERLIVVQGFMQAVALLGHALAERGAVSIAVEDPSQNRPRTQLASTGLRVLGWRVDEHGAVPADDGAAAAIVTPAHQFPTGVVLSGERRRELLAWAARTGGLVVEDDYDAEFRYDREPVRALQGLDPERVAYVGTVSKTLAPALRLGWLLAPEPLVEPVTRLKLHMDSGSPVLNQLALGEFVRNGGYDRHLRRTRAVYRTRRDRLIDVLAATLPGLRIGGISAGLHLLLDLPPGTDDRAVAQAAADAGVAIEPRSEYAVDRPGPPGLIVGYGKVHEAAIPAAVELLARAVDAVL